MNFGENDVLLLQIEISWNLMIEEDYKYRDKLKFKRRRKKGSE